MESRRALRPVWAGGKLTDGGGGGGGPAAGGGGAAGAAGAGGGAGAARVCTAGFEADMTLKLLVVRCGRLNAVTGDLLSICRSCRGETSPEIVALLAESRFGSLSTCIVLRQQWLTP
jgi:hypothetical protein